MIILSLRHFPKIFLVLPLMLVGCDKPYKETCDKKCQKCIADCYKECERAFNVCLGSASPFNKSSYENCPYYGNQCVQTCPEKCMTVKVGNPTPPLR